jgi:hypothetical protein
MMPNKISLNKLIYFHTTFPHLLPFVEKCLFACSMGFNATFNNISAISWWSVLLAEEIGGSAENHQPVASH